MNHNENDKKYNLYVVDVKQKWFDNNFNSKIKLPCDPSDLIKRKAVNNLSNFFIIGTEVKGGVTVNKTVGNQMSNIKKLNSMQANLSGIGLICTNTKPVGKFNNNISKENGEISSITIISGDEKKNIKLKSFEDTLSVKEHLNNNPNFYIQINIVSDQTWDDVKKNGLQNGIGFIDESDAISYIKRAQQENLSISEKMNLDIMKIDDKLENKDRLIEYIIKESISSFDEYKKKVDKNEKKSSFFSSLSTIGINRINIYLELFHHKHKNPQVKEIMNLIALYGLASDKKKLGSSKNLKERIMRTLENHGLDKPDSIRNLIISKSHAISPEKQQEDENSSEYFSNIENYVTQINEGLAKGLPSDDLKKFVSSLEGEVENKVGILNRFVKTNF